MENGTNLVSFRVIGLRVEKHIDTYDDLDYQECWIESERHLVFIKPLKNNAFWSRNIYCVQLEDMIGPCGSGYCMSSWGCMDIHLVDEIGPLTHKPIGDIQFDAYISDEDMKTGNIKWIEPVQKQDKDEECSWCPEGFCMDIDQFGDVFAWSGDGGDSYYPCGGVWVNFDLFEELPRAMKKRPVWIFKGASGLGKSTIASFVNDQYRVFETDSVNALPDELWYDVIVLGNRSGFSINEIKTRLVGDPEIIVVDFAKEEK